MEASFRTTTLGVLQMPRWEPEDHTSVCSYLTQGEDLSVSNRGPLRASRSLEVRVCRICFATDCKLYSMTAYNKLYKAYETVTGLLIENEEGLPMYQCSECARRLLNCASFRTSSLQAHSVLLQIARSNGYISLELLKGIDSPLNLNHTDCNLDIELVENTDLYTDKQDFNIDGIKAENDDMVSQENPKADDITDNNMSCLGNLGADIVDDVVNVKNDYREDLDAEDTTNDDVECMYKLRESMVGGDDIKTEADSVMMQDCSNEISSYAIAKCGDIFKCEDHSSDTSFPVADAREKAKLDHTDGEVSKASKDLVQEKIDTPRNCKVYGELSVNNKLSCDKCHYQANSELSLLTHLKAHAVTEFCCCDMCSYMTVHSNDQSQLLKTRTGTKPFSCDICDKEFNQRSSLRAHMRIHTGEKQLACHICSKVFIRQDHLVAHMRIHTGEKPYSCDICNKGFAQKSHLVIHSRTHTGEKPYSCDICNNVFAQNSQLVIHMSIHSSGKSFSCNICGKAFNYKNSLKLHIRTHTGEKPFVCDICHKAFSDKRVLGKHLRIHTGEKPHLCIICNEGFSQKRYLTIHMKKHTGEKPFTCDICNKAYAHKPYFKRHMRTHSGEKPYSCKSCNKAFIEKSQLTKHMKTHTSH